MRRKRRPLAALAVTAMVALISGCASSAPASNASDGSSGGDSTAANHEKAVKFAACMRANGVKAFPDPSASGNFTIEQVANGSSLDPNTPAVKQAVSACKRLEPSGFTGTKRSPQQQSAALKSAQCIRANGVPDFPDPDPNGPIIDTNRIPSAHRPGGMSALHAAMQKCRGLGAAAGVTR